MSGVEFVFCAFMLALGLFAAGHMVGYHSGWQDGYWTDHPPTGKDET